MFRDRSEAGKLLAVKLSQYKRKKDVIILGIPRGGVEVAYTIAKELNCKLGIAVAKKIPFPGNPELAIGAVALGGVASLDESFLGSHGIGQGYIDSEKKRLASEITRRYKAYGAELPDVKGKIAILVDDGMATGHTVLAAAMALKKGKPKKLIVAVPVSSRQAAELLKAEADDVLCLEMPEFFMSVGQFYQSFPQLTDEDVTDYLKQAGRK